MISNSGDVTNLSASFEVLHLSVMQSSFGFTNPCRKLRNPSVKLKCKLNAETLLIRDLQHALNENVAVVKNSLFINLQRM